MARRKKAKKANLSHTHKASRLLTKKALIFIGILLMSASLFYHLNRTLDEIYIQKASAVNSCVENRLSPSHISIPSQEVSAKVEDSLLVGNIWQISREKVSHLKSSAVPGQNGNIIMYGHNTKNNFLNLQFLREGDKIIVTNKEGKQYAYVITSTMTVLPTEVWALKETQEQTLTLYTCVGLGDTMRLVIRAVPATSTISKSEGKSCKGQT